MPTFKQKPKSKKEFFEKLDQLNSEELKDNKIPEYQNTKNSKIGRPIKHSKDKVVKTSMSMSKKEYQQVQAMMDSLVMHGVKNPYPSASDIYKIGIYLAASLPTEKLLDIYKTIKEY